MMTDVTPSGISFYPDSELGVILRKKVLGSGFFGVGISQKIHIGTSFIILSLSFSLRSRCCVRWPTPFVNSFLLGGCCCCCCRRRRSYFLPRRKE